MLDTEVSNLLTLMDEGFPRVHEMSPQEARAAVAARRAQVTNVDDVRSTEDRTVPTEDGPLRVRVYWPHEPAKEAPPVVVFLHGGGFVFCDIESHDGFCRTMSRGTGSIVVSVDYRLAPEHKAPAAAEDAHAALRWAADNARELGGDSDRIVVAGDSAGGNMAAVACLMARDRVGPRVAAQVMAYPVIDPSCDTDSYHQYATGYFNTKAAMKWYWQQYLPAGPLPEPVDHVAPLRAPSLTGLPPAVVITAGLDPLCSEGTAYAQALQRARVPTIHRHYPDLFHGFLTIAGFGAATAACELLWNDLYGLLTSNTVQGRTA